MPQINMKTVDEVVSISLVMSLGVKRISKSEKYIKLKKNS